MSNIFKYVLIGMLALLTQADPNSDGLYNLPGLKIRLAQGMFDIMKQHLAYYYVAYLNNHQIANPEGNFSLKMWPMVYFDFHYTDLTHDPINFDLSTLAFDFTSAHDEEMGMQNQDQVLYIHLPLIKDWSFSMNYEARLGFFQFRQKKGECSIRMKETTAYLAVKLETNDKGLLVPQIQSINVNFGGSTLDSDKWWNKFWLRQNFNIVKYIFEDSINRFGTKLYSHVLPDMVAKKTNNQHKMFKLQLDQIEKLGIFGLDYRLVHKPAIYEGNLDLDFLFDIGEGMTPCRLAPDSYEFSFENYGRDYLQLVMTERVPNCLLDAMERQDFFEFKINSEWIAQKLGTYNLPINVAMFEGAFPALTSHYDKSDELDFEFKIIHPRVHFMDNYASNILLKGEIHYGFKEFGSMNYILFDKLRYDIEMTLEISEEVVFANIQKIMMRPSDLERKVPVFYDAEKFNGQLDQDAYRQFSEFLNNRVTRLYTWLNEQVLQRGVPLPYWKLSFLTKLGFQRGAMTAVIHLFYYL